MKHLGPVLVGLLTIAPQLMPIIPPQYRDVASALIATTGALIHLYVPVPSAPSKEQSK